jgi:hypothetical protein
MNEPAQQPAQPPGGEANAFDVTYDLTEQLFVTASRRAVYRGRSRLPMILLGVGLVAAGVLAIAAGWRIGGLASLIVGTASLLVTLALGHTVTRTARTRFRKHGPVRQILAFGPQGVQVRLYYLPPKAGEEPYGSRNIAWHRFEKFLTFPDMLLLFDTGGNLYIVPTPLLTAEQAQFIQASLRAARVRGQ